MQKFILRQMGLLGVGSQPRKKCPATQLCVGFGEIGCVGMCIEDHVGGVITNCGIGISVEIVKEMLGMFDCLCGCF